MQRRAAAIYAVFFLVIGAASYSLIATADSPSIAFENPDHRLQQGDTFSVGDQEYTVTSVEASEASGGGGGHGGGGGGGITHSGEVAWTVQSSEYTATWENDSEVTFEDESYTVVIPDTNDPNEFVLRETINRSAILADDPQADNETVTRDGQEQVVVTENGTSRLVPADEYFPDPDERQFSEGQQIQYRGNATTIQTVTNQSATLAWTAPRNNTASLSQESNVTLSGTTYLAYFPNNDTVVLTSDFQSYERQTAEIDTYTEQKNGLWGISIVSGMLVVLLVGMAYLPSRY
jgi:hypothetical protein